MGMGVVGVIIKTQPYVGRSHARICLSGEVWAESLCAHNSAILRN